MSVIIDSPKRYQTSLKRGRSLSEKRERNENSLPPQNMKANEEKLLSSTAFYYRFHRFSISSHKKVFFISEREEEKLTQIFINLWLCARETITHTAVDDDVEMRRKLRRFFPCTFWSWKLKQLWRQEEKKNGRKISATWTASDENTDKTEAKLFSHLQVSTCRFANVPHSHSVKAADA